MKKVKFILVFLISIFTFNINVFAASGSLSVSTNSVYVGNGFTVTVNVNSAAAWNIHVSASGPVSGCSINQADATSDAMDTNKTFKANCTATGTGTITITLSGDVTSASNGNAVNVSGSKTVTVTQKPTTTKPTTTKPATTKPTTTKQSNNNNNNSNNNSNNNNTTEVKSNNNSIKELSVDGYELVKINNNNYTLSVTNDVSSINIKAIAADSKAKITGAGIHNLNVGVNNIVVVITAENGSQNKINIKVTKKDGYYLEDLDSILQDDKIDDKNIIIKSDTSLTSQDIEKIKNSGKTVSFNYYNNDKKLVYTWIVDGSKLNNIDNLMLNINNDTENKADILRLSNYADGIFMGLNQINNLSSGLKLRLFVGDKYKDDDLVNVYSYLINNDKLELINKGINVLDGYIEFDATKASDYFVTMSTIPSNEPAVPTVEKTSNPLLFVIIGVLSLIIVCLLTVLLLKKKNKKEDIDNPIDNNYGYNPQNRDTSLNYDHYNSSNVETQTTNNNLQNNSSSIESNSYYNDNDLFN